MSSFCLVVQLSTCMFIEQRLARSRFSWHTHLFVKAQQEGRSSSSGTGLRLLRTDVPSSQHSLLSHIFGPVSHIFNSSAFPIFTSRTSFTTSCPLSRRDLTTALSATPLAPLTHTLRRVHQPNSSADWSGRAPGDDHRDRGRRLAPWSAPVDGRGEELGSARAQHLISSRATRHSDGQLAAHPVCVCGWGKGHGGLVLCGVTWDREQDLTASKAQKAQGAGKLAHHRRA